jgi:hypothetical protein
MPSLAEIVQRLCAAEKKMEKIKKMFESCRDMPHDAVWGVIDELGIDRTRWRTTAPLAQLNPPRS